MSGRAIIPIRIHFADKNKSFVFFFFAYLSFRWNIQMRHFCTIIMFFLHAYDFLNTNIVFTKQLILHSNCNQKTFSRQTINTTSREQTNLKIKEKYENRSFILSLMSVFLSFVLVFALYRDASRLWIHEVAIFVAIDISR